MFVFISLFNFRGEKKRNKHENWPKCTISLEIDTSAPFWDRFFFVLGPFFSTRKRKKRRNNDFVDFSLQLKTKNKRSKKKRNKNEKNVFYFTKCIYIYIYIYNCYIYIYIFTWFASIPSSGLAVYIIRFFDWHGSRLSEMQMKFAFEAV